MIEGCWEPFMLMDVSVTLARLIRLDVRRYSTYAKDIYDQVAATASSQESDLKNYFKTLFDLCFSMTVLLDNYYRSLPDDFEFKEIIGNTVRSRLPEYLYRLQAYYQAAKTEGLINPQGTFLFADRPGELILSQDFRAGDLSDIWTSPGLPPSFTPAFSGTNSSLKIKNTITHNLFTGMVDQYLKVLASLVETAPGYLDATMSEFPTHSPHYALFLAFIKLFRISQDRLNNFTAKIGRAHV